MRIVRITPLVLLFAAYAIRAADEAVPSAPVAPAIIFHIEGKQPDEKVKAELLRMGMDLLKSANFNTVQHADILRQSVPLIQDHYRHSVTSDYVLIRYDQPITVKTVGGDVRVFDIVIGLARPDYVSSLFTVDDQGRVVAHEKYSGGLAIEFKKAVGTSAN